MNRSSLIVACWLSLAACAEEEAPPASEPEPAATELAVESPPPAALPSAALSPPPDELVLVAGGDVNLGRAQGQMILEDPAYDPFRHIRGWLAGGDLRFANLESQLSDQKGETQSPHHKLVFTGPPGGADVLKAAGFDIVSLANNHAWDYQRRGFEETLDNLERVGIVYTGVSREPGKHYEPTIVEVKGWSLAFFAVTHIWNAGRYSTHPGRNHVAWASWDQLKKKVERAHAEHDLVIVSYHGGVEYAATPYPPPKRFIDAAMRSGHVDVLLGHHPHVPRGVGWFGDRPALYSLGNLVFGKRSDNRWERTSYLARLTFRRRAGQRPATGLELCAYDLRGHSPYPFEDARRQAAQDELAAHLSKISEPLGGTRFGAWTKDGCLRATPPPREEQPSVSRETAERRPR